MPDKIMSVVLFNQTGNVLSAFTHEANAAAPKLDLFATSGLLCRASDAGTVFESVLPANLLQISEFKFDEGLIAAPRNYSLVDGSPQRVVTPVKITGVTLTTSKLSITFDPLDQARKVYVLVEVEGEDPRILAGQAQPAATSIDLADTFTSQEKHSIFVFIEGLIPFLTAKTP